MSTDQNDQGLEGYKRLEQIAASIEDGRRVEPATLRELLGWFGASCRGVRTNQTVRDALIKNNLRIEPDIHAAVLDSEIEFHVGSQEFDWLRARIRSDFLATRVADWIDQNPTVTESEIAAKVAEMEQLPISDLSSDDADEAIRILERVERADQIEYGPEGEKRLKQIATSLEDGKTTEPMTVRQLLRWFGTERRGVFTTFMIRQALIQNNVRSEPSFDRAPIGGTIQFQTGYKCDKVDDAIMKSMRLNLVFDRLSAWCDLHPASRRANFGRRPRRYKISNGRNLQLRKVVR